MTITYMHHRRAITLSISHQKSPDACSPADELAKIRTSAGRGIRTLFWNTCKFQTTAATPQLLIRAHCIFAHHERPTDRCMPAGRAWSLAWTGTRSCRCSGTARGRPPACTMWHPIEKMRNTKRGSKRDAQNRAALSFEDNIMHVIWQCRTKLRSMSEKGYATMCGLK